MGKKDNKLMDDSSLIDALEGAISNYKVMHGLKQTDVMKNVALNEEEIADKDNVESYNERVGANDTDALLNSLAEPTMPTIGEEVRVDTLDELVDEDVANGTLELEGVEASMNEQPDAEYNALVNQYYDLQEKLQETWQKLQLFGNSSDQCTQYATEAGLLDTTTEIKEASDVAFDATDDNGPKTLQTLGENDLIRLAMEAAEKAISSIKIQTVDQQEGSEQTDISTVLKAWFSAGLTTGKYLTEQSNSGRQ